MTQDPPSKKSIIRGPPPDLDRILLGFDPSIHSNLNREDLVTSIVAHTLSGVHWPGTEIPLTEKVYCFFIPSQCSWEIRFAGHHDLYVGLNPELYGFDELVTIAPTVLPDLFPDHARSVFAQILGRTSIAMNELLELVGSAINESIEYDFERVIDLRTRAKLDTSKYEILRRTHHERDPRESIRGICSDAGRLIRTAMRYTGLDQRYVFSWVKTGSSDDTHDTTLLLDTFTARWAVINSKSPTKRYNLITFAQLDELWTPYRPIVKDMI